MYLLMNSDRHHLYKLNVSTQTLFSCSQQLKFWKLEFQTTNEQTCCMCSEVFQCHCRISSAVAITKYSVTTESRSSDNKQLHGAKHTSANAAMSLASCLIKLWFCHVTRLLRVDAKKKKVPQSHPCNK